MFDMSSTVPANLLQQLQSLLYLAQSLCERCDKLIHIPGISKLKKKCEAELRFLKGLEKKVPFKKSCLSSTNLTHLQGVVEAAETLPHVVQVMQPFPCGHSDNPLVVDIVCNYGYTWVKVIARKAQAMHVIWAGRGHFGEKSIIHQGEQYMSCAALYPVCFTTPQVLFLFTSGITTPLADALDQAGISVFGQRVDANFDAGFRSEDSENESEVSGGFAEGDMDPGLFELSEDESEPIPSASDFYGAFQNPGDIAVQRCTESSQGQLYDSKVGKSIKSCNSADPDFYKACQNEINQALIESSSQPKGLVQQKSSSDGSSHPEESPSLITSGLRTEVCEEFHGTPPMESGESQAAQVDALGEFLLGLDVSLLIPLFKKVPEITKVNMDITTMISLVSNLCHGRNAFCFEEPILTQQATAERARPLLPKVEAFLEGKELYVCDTAMQDFNAILQTVGGPSEKKRAELLLEKVKVIPDRISDRTETLELSAKIKQRAKIIFGTGDAMRAVTITANSGFIRSASNQGMNFAVFLHESRALTEQKEATASPL